MADPTGVGYFGKLPGAGDFVRRRLPPEFIDRWDRCFEAALYASRGVFGQNWRAGWRASPLWRFALPPGVCGATAWVGLMGPSIDRVGRGFPMALAAPLRDSDAVMRVLREGARWFAAVQCVYLEAQADDGMDAATFEARVLALREPLHELSHASETDAQEINWALGDAWRVPWLRTSGHELLRRWNACMAAGDGCLWWTHGGARVPPTMLLTRGLPEPAAYAGFLDASYMPGPWQTDPGFDALTPAPAAAHAPPQGHVLPADMDDVFADLLPSIAPSFRQPPEPVVQAVDEIQASAAAAQQLPAVAVMKRCDGMLTLVVADEGPLDARRQAAAAVRSVVAGMPDELLAHNMQALFARLLAIHPGLLERREDLINPVPEDGAVIAAYVTADRADVWRIGNAAGWHWRRGQLRPIFNAASAVSSEDDTERKDAFGNLIGHEVHRPLPGLGAAEAPQGEAVACTLEAGDRLLLAATGRLLQLSPEAVAGALGQPSCEDAHAQFAIAANLGGNPSAWPFTVIEVGR